MVNDPLLIFLFGCLVGGMVMWFITYKLERNEIEFEKARNLRKKELKRLAPQPCRWVSGTNKRK